MPWRYHADGPWYWYSWHYHADGPWVLHEWRPYWQDAYFTMGEWGLELDDPMHRAVTLLEPLLRPHGSIYNIFCRWKQDVFGISLDFEESSSSTDQPAGEPGLEEEEPPSEPDA